LQRVSEEGKGVVVILGGYQFGSELVEQQLDTRFNADSSVAINDNSRLMQVGVGSQILRDLGVRKMRLMSAPVKYTGIAGFDLEVVEYIQPED
jgi:3,4-dihydroxy 2-butanone 4-phosphate synthase/GTP cyclohydrolase II